MVRLRARFLWNVLVVVAASGGAVGFGGCSDAAVPAPPVVGGGAATGGAAAGGASSSAGAGGLGAGGALAASGASGASTAGAAGAPTSGGGGATGSAGAGGGASGAAGSTMTGRPSGPSAGCTAPLPADPIQKAVQHDLTVTVAAKYQPPYVPRRYYTTLPKEWDPVKPYPVLFYGAGCGQTVSQGGPYTNGHFQSEALFVELIPAVVTADTVVPRQGGAPGCFQAGREGFADSPDGPYFDQVLAEIEKAYCVDTGKVYVAGWSSGAWLANYLACARGNVITGTAAGSGGLQHDHGACTGGAAVMILPGDAASTPQNGFDIGAGPARDTFLAANGCAATSQNVKFGNVNCQIYDGCKQPVTWCDGGGDHGGPLNVIAEASWGFWKP